MGNLLQANTAPAREDRRIVALDDAGLGDGAYAVWLINELPSPRGEVQVFRDWIINEVQPGLSELQRIRTLLK